MGSSNEAGASPIPSNRLLQPTSHRMLKRRTLPTQIGMVEPDAEIVQRKQSIELDRRQRDRPDAAAAVRVGAVVVRRLRGGESFVFGVAATGIAARAAGAGALSDGIQHKHVMSGQTGKTDGSD